MSGIGPLEPGEDTRAEHTGVPEDSRARRRDRRRRFVLVAAVLVALLAGVGFLQATRTRQLPRPAPPSPAPPYPSQVVDVSYLDPVATPRGAPPGSFSFALLVSVESGPPVTVSALDQPYAGLSVASTPRPPFRTAAGTARKIVITLHVRECGKVPENAGLPFLDVTLRNTRAMEVQSFILGPRYARALSEALQVACGNVSRSSPKHLTHLNAAGRVLRVLRMRTGRIGLNSAVPPAEYRSAIRRVITRTSQHWSDSPPRSPRPPRVTASHRTVGKSLRAGARLGPFQGGGPCKGKD
ncbi:hypothetical protein ACLMNJ_07525 [Streptomyces seoulensis]